MKARAIAPIPLLALSLLCPGSARAFDPVDALKHAGAACDAATAYTYDYTYKGHGSLTGDYRGSVRLLQGDTTTPTRIYVHTFVTTGAGLHEVITVTDGETTTVVDFDARTVTTGTSARGGAHLMFHIYYAVLFQFVQPGAFQFEAAEGEPSVAGTREVDGVACQVVRVKHPFGASVEWALGTKDRFPRAQVWKNEQAGQEGGFDFQVHDLDFQARLSVLDFAIDPPDGFQLIDDDARAIAVGKTAPEWNATTTDGTELSSKALASSVVVLDFWASWCPPCWKLMPVIEKLSGEFAARGVRFVGVNTWESDRTNARAYMRDKGFTYDQVLHGEDLAGIFKVSTLPAIVVIGRDGRVALLEVGGAGVSEDTLRRQLEASLEAP